MKSKKSRKKAVDLRTYTQLRARGLCLEKKMTGARTWRFKDVDGACALVLTLESDVVGTKKLRSQYRNYVVSCTHCSRRFLINVPVRPHPSDGVEIAGIYGSMKSWRLLFKKVLGEQVK